MGACLSTKKEKARGTLPAASASFKIYIKIDSTEAVSRLVQIRRSITYSDADISLLLRTVDKGGQLELELLHLSHEIEVTMNTLQKRKLGERNDLYECIKMLEDACPSMKTLLGHLGMYYEDGVRPSKFCQRQVAKLLGSVAEARTQLACMRSNLMQEATAEMLMLTSQRKEGLIKCLSRIAC